MNPRNAWKHYKHERLFAIWDSLVMWNILRYKRFVWGNRPGQLDQEWFDWFVKKWGVARTLDRRNRNNVRKYLDKQFRAAIRRSPAGSTVDVAANHIQRKGWSSRTRKDGRGSSVRSLVSKVGFFFCPDKIVPYDSFARAGLSILRGGVQGGRHESKLQESYEQYLESFNEKFLSFRPLLTAELHLPWVKALARQFGCPPQVFDTVRFQRKTFDNLLVHVGKSRR